MKYCIYILFIGGMLLGTWACTEDFEELNMNPNGATEVSTGFLLTGAQKAAMDYTWDEWWNGRRGNQLAQFWASNQYSSESRYAHRPTITNTYWALFYSGSTNADLRNGGGITDLMEIIRLCNENPEQYAAYGDVDNQKAVAKIMMAWIYQMITDCWGPIPFSQSNLGAENPTPGYDSQEDVYNGLLNMLTEASDQINTGAAGPDGDAIYSGDMAKWKKFANSLKLRVALRMADAAPNTAKSAAEEAIAAGVFESNDDSALFPYMGAAPNNNPINEDYKTRNDFAASNIMIDELKELDDPRIGEYFEPAANSGEFVGEVYGLSEDNAAATPNGDVSQRGERVLQADFPGIYLDYPTVEFMLAEAAERGYQNVPLSAAEHYENGIRASMEFWGVSQSEVDDYVSSDEVDYNTQLGSNTWREVIGKQKWIALYMQGIEGWTEWRRLDFGILQPPADGALMGDGVPMRMLYPRDEQTLNGQAYNSAVNNMLGGPDALGTKLWWDVN